MIATHSKYPNAFPWQIFLNDGRCVLVSEDGTDTTTINSRILADDQDNIVDLNSVPSDIMEHVMKLTKGEN